MPELRVVALRISDAWRGFGRGGERFLGVGLASGMRSVGAMVRGNRAGAMRGMSVKRREHATANRS